MHHKTAVIVSDFGEQQTELKEYRELQMKDKLRVEFCAFISPPLFYRSPKSVGELI